MSNEKKDWLSINKTAMALVKEEATALYQDGKLRIGLDKTRTIIHNTAELSRRCN